MSEHSPFVTISKCKKCDTAWLGNYHFTKYCPGCKRENIGWETGRDPFVEEIHILRENAKENYPQFRAKLEYEETLWLCSELAYAIRPYRSLPLAKAVEELNPKILHNCTEVIACEDCLIRFKCYTERKS